MTNEPNEGASSGGPAMQPPVSGSVSADFARKIGWEGDVEKPQAQLPGLPTEGAPQGEEGEPQESDDSGEPLPVVPGLDESDYSLLSEEERAKLAPMLKKIERAVNEKMQLSAEAEKKAAAWDAALTIPKVAQALEAHLKGDAGDDSAQAGPSQDIHSLTNDMGDLDPAKLQGLITQTVEGSLSKAMQPLKQELEALRGHVGQSVVDGQFRALEGKLPGLADHRPAIMDMLAKGEATSIESAYDQIQGRLFREGKLKPSKPSTQAPSAPPSDEQNRRQSVVAERFGPGPARLSRSRTVGMEEHLRGALAALGFDGIETPD